MVKTKMKLMSASLIVLALFNLCSFLIPFVKGISFWLGYGFSMFGLVLMIVVGAFTLHQPNIRSTFFHLPLIYMAWTHLIVQLIFSFLCMSIQAIPWQLEVIVSSLLAGACLLGLITAGMGREGIEKADKKISEKVFYMQSLKTDIDILQASASSQPLNDALRTLAEEIRFSDPISGPELSELENRIAVKTAALKEVMDSNDPQIGLNLCKEIQKLLTERNLKCRMLKV